MAEPWQNLAVVGWSQVGIWWIVGGAWKHLVNDGGESDRICTVLIFETKNMVLLVGLKNADSLHYFENLALKILVYLFITFISYLYFLLEISKAANKKYLYK